MVDNTFVTYFPGSRQIPLVGQNRHVTGAGISFLVHAVAICCIIFASSALSNFTPPLVIDFSIEKSDGTTTAKKAVAQIVQKQNPPAPEIKQVPPAPQPMPEKVKVAIPKKIEPIVTKKVVVEKEKPKQIETVEVQKLQPEKILPDKIVASEEPVDDNLKKLLKANDSVPAAGPVVTKSPFLQKEQYKKEHFLYIKERVQGKISYPRIARKMGWQGRVLISFVICRDGSVKDIRIVESSGFNALDKNAVEVIRKVAPFPRPPVSAELIIPVIYKLS